MLCLCALACLRVLQHAAWEAVYMRDGERLTQAQAQSQAQAQAHKDIYRHTDTRTQTHSHKYTDTQTHTHVVRQEKGGVEYDRKGWRF